MKWPIALCLLSYACMRTLGAPSARCPKFCACLIEENNDFEVSCDSTQFLQNVLALPLANNMTTLSLNNCGISNLKWNMTHMIGLKALNLYSNKLTHIDVANLPKSLVYLNLSFNSIRQLPEELTSLPNLKTINILGNPISCTCKSLNARDEILKQIALETVVECDSPKSLKGKPFLEMYCKKDDVVERLISGRMQSDGPYEGSGLDEEGVIDDENIESADHLGSDIEDEYMLMKKLATPAKTLENLVELTTTTLPTPPSDIEGSGIGDAELNDYDYLENSTFPDVAQVDDEFDDEIDDALYDDYSSVSEDPNHSINMSLPNACNFNCSTPTPLENSNETDLNPSPGLFEAAKMLFSDINIFGDESETTTVPTTVTTKATVIVNVVKSTEPSIDTNFETAAVGNETSEIKGKMKSGETDQSSSTYIFLFILLALVVALIVFAIFKRRSIQRKRKAKKIKLEELEAGAEEMKLLKNPTVEVNNKPNGTNETVALINGQKNGVEPSDANLSNGTKPEDDDVEIRTKNEDYDSKLLTPEAKRVTVKASEIPNSTPKTPILVTRHLNSDGSIVTTPNSDQQIQ